MKKLFDLKFIFIAIFLFLTIAIKNSENFQLRDFDDGVSETGSSKVSKVKQSTKIRYPFRKLEKIEESVEDNDDDDDDEDENDSEEDKTDYTFAKVRKPTFEVKKRTNLRYSKLAQFRDPKDTQNDDDDDDDDDEDDEKISFFSRVVNFFKRKPKTEEEEDSNENESKENTTDDSAEVNSKEDDADDQDDDDEPEDKPILTEIFDKFKDFLEARSKQSKQSDDDDESSGDASAETDDDKDDENSGEDESEPESEKIEKKPAESKIKISIKETLSTIFNRVPFNLVFDFDDDDDEGEKLEDSEEDEINYQRLLKEEREHMHQHVDQLIKQSSEEDSKPSEVETVESPKAEDVKTSTKPKKEKKSKEEAHLAQKEFEKLLLNLPSFVPDYSKVKNPECQKQGEVFQRQLRGQRIWALQMMDATAKIPSGLMRGNTNQLGDFDLCTKISQKIKISESHSMKMKGKYCLANIDVVAAADQLKLPVHLIQGRNFIRSTINDVSEVMRH